MLAIVGLAVMGLVTPAWAKKPGPPVSPPFCGNGVIEADRGEVCDGTNLGDATCADAGLAGGTLTCDSNCQYDTSGCSRSSSSFPATGQTTKYVAGDDGDVRAGAPLSFTDNADGTITDNVTGLVWEAKTSCDGAMATDAHDGDNVYPWSGRCNLSIAPCGTTADCPTGETCEASGGFCDSGPSGLEGFCMRDADCPGPDSCYDEDFDGLGYCSTSGEECGSADDCETGETCVCSRCHNGGRRCSISARDCHVDADCPTGETCAASDKTIFQWVAELNSQIFAGHDDWRAPNVKELMSMADYGAYSPPVPAVFNSGASSCTKPPVVFVEGWYWSSTTLTRGAGHAYGVELFFSAGVDHFDWTDRAHVRAVRGGVTTP